MKSLQTKQCECGSKAFLGRHCVLCHEALPEADFKTSPSRVALNRFLQTRVLHLVPSWLIFAGLMLFSTAVWIPNSKKVIPAVYGAFILSLLSISYLGAPLAGYYRRPFMRFPSPSEQAIAVGIVRCVSLILLLYVTMNMLTGRIPLVMR